MSSPVISRHLSDITDFLVDNRVGIIRSINPILTASGTPEFFHFSAQLCNTGPLGRETSCAYLAAASDNRERAVSLVVMDALAIYCAALNQEQRDPYRVHPAKLAPFPSISPSDFALFSPEQYEMRGFPYVPFDDSTTIAWTEGWDPLRNQAVFVPSAMTFLPYSPASDHGELLIGPPNSVGLACHWDAKQAAVKAICDVVECDALAILWYARLTPPQIRVETLSDANYDLVARFERTGGSVTLLRVESDFAIPTILASLSNSSPRATARVFAAGCDPDPEQAIRESLETLAHVNFYCQMYFDQRSRETQPLAKDISDQAGHLRFWCEHSNAALSDFLLSSQERIEFDDLHNFSMQDPDEDLENLLYQLEASDHRLVLVDLTTADISELGLTVARAIIPGLQPLFFGSGMQALGGARLSKLIAKANPCSANDSTVSVDLPHPFPRKGVL